MRLSDPYNVAEFRPRATAVAILFIVFFFLILVRLWYLQIWKGEIYREFSDRNRFKIERLSAPRGQLLDRNGELIADARPRFDLMFTRGNSPFPEMELAQLGKVLKWTEAELEKKQEFIRKSPRYQAKLIAQDISSDELALIESQTLEYPGIDIEVVAVRDYLFNDNFFHVLGYTGEINDRELPRWQERYPERNYRLGDEKGVIGIESAFEGLLRGKDGRDFIVVDVKGRRINHEQWELLPKVSRVEPEAGLSLRLSLDLSLQLETTKAFEGKTGAAVALDPKTGQILAYVSRPGLDPNMFTRPISSETFQRLTNQPKNPFLDRVVGEHYPPGSTFKLIMAAAALESCVIDRNTSHFCPGYFRFGRRIWKCHHHSGHGRVNVVQAIERSCDVFFYNVGLGLGLDNMFAWSTRFGLGRRTYIANEVFPGKHDRLTRFNSEVPGFIPSEEWVHAKKWTTVEAETINAAIGQGAYTMTALQLARVMAAIGNGGLLYQPQLVLGSARSSGQVVEEYSAQVENQIDLDPRSREIVLQGMREVIQGAEGTARGSRLPNLEYGGKTGTAQVVALDISKAFKRQEFEDHALFVALAPLQDPKIAIAIVVENGGQGSRAAAPIAKAMIRNYLMRDQAMKEESDGKIISN